MAGKLLTAETIQKFIKGNTSRFDKYLDKVRGCRKHSITIENLKFR